jgi:hypothetical protein
VGTANYGRLQSIFSKKITDFRIRLRIRGRIALLREQKMF